MKYLIRERGKKKAAHIWCEVDTACRMWSTGGLNKKTDWLIEDTTLGLEVCTMCKVNYAKLRLGA